MKRHKYKFPYLTKPINRQQEISLMVNKYILKINQIPSKIKFKSKKIIKKNHIPISKIHSYCIITGRVRGVVSLTQTSRHIFNEYTKAGFMTGFHFSSKD